MSNNRKSSCNSWILPAAMMIAFVLVSLGGTNGRSFAGGSGDVAGGGCEGPDADGDGTPDACDNCPNTPGRLFSQSETVNQQIPEGITCGAATTSLPRTITLDDPGEAAGVRVMVNLVHGAYSDVDIKLLHSISPTEVAIITLNPVSSLSTTNRNTRNLDGSYVFDDFASTMTMAAAASQCFGNNCPAVPPGTYRPSEPLGFFSTAAKDA